MNNKTTCIRPTTFFWDCLVRFPCYHLNCFADRFYYIGYFINTSFVNNGLKCLTMSIFLHNIARCRNVFVVRFVIEQRSVYISIPLRLVWLNQMVTSCFLSWDVKTFLQPGKTKLTTKQRVPTHKLMSKIMFFPIGSPCLSNFEAI